MPTKERRRKEIAKAAPQKSDNNGKRLRFELRIGDYRLVDTPFSGKGMRLSVTHIAYQYADDSETPVKVHALTVKGCLIIRDPQTGKLQFRPPMNKDYRTRQTVPTAIVTPDTADDIIRLASQTRYIERVGEGALPRDLLEPINEPDVSMEVE